MKVLKICISEWKNASRDERELAVCEELGAETTVIAKGPVSGVREDVDGFSVIRLSSRPLGTCIPNNINRLVSLFTWASFVRKMPGVDVISGHDYIALLIGWLSNVGKRRKAKLIYDSHEFELGRNQQRGSAARFFVCHLECFLMKQCAFSIMVNDSIAHEVQRIHRLKERPVVVRNIPICWKLDDEKIAQTRRELLKQLHMPQDTFLVIYHGGVLPNRGIEQMLSAVARLSGVSAVVLGNGDTAYLSSLHRMCEALDIADRVLFHEAVPATILYRFVGAANAGFSLLQPIVQNHIMALPNKFFECIQSLTLVIVSDFPEIGALTDQYGIGLKVDPTDPDAIAAAIERLRTDKEFYAACKEHLKAAKETLCWENEKETLKSAYRVLLS